VHEPSAFPDTDGSRQSRIDDASKRVGENDRSRYDHNEPSPRGRQHGLFWGVQGKKEEKVMRKEGLIGMNWGLVGRNMSSDLEYNSSRHHHLGKSGRRGPVGTGEGKKEKGTWKKARAGGRIDE